MIAYPDFTPQAAAPQAKPASGGGKTAASKTRSISMPHSTPSEKLAPPAKAKGSAKDFLEIAELLSLYGDMERAQRIAGYALGRGLSREALDQSHYGKRFSLIEKLSAPGAMDEEDRLAVTQKGKIRDIPPERWLHILMKKMARAGLPKEAVAFGRENSYLDPTGAAKRIAELEAAEK